MTWITKEVAAARLGIHPNSLYSFWKRYKIASEKQPHVINGKTYHRRVYCSDDVDRILADGYDATKAKKRAAKMAVTENHPYKNLEKTVGARETLTPLQRARVNLTARQRIENGERVREVEELDLSWVAEYDERAKK